MGELKAEQMLSILTAAETEMYETSKKNEESQVLSNSMQKSGKINISQSASIHVQTDNDDETKEHLDKIEKLEKEKLSLEVQLKNTSKSDERKEKSTLVVERELDKAKKRAQQLNSENKKQVVQI